MPLQFELRSHRRIDRREEPRLLLNRECPGRAANDRQVVKPQLVRLPLNANDQRGPVKE